MCGIAGYSLSPNVRINSKRITREMLLAIEHRGRDATGFAFRDSTGAFQVHKRDIPAQMFVKRNLCVPRSQRTVIMHTRWATQGAPENNNNNHPILAGSVVGVHNGHVSNDDQLFDVINRTVGNNVRVAEVDSEAAFALLGYMDAPVTSSLEEIRGGAALAWMDACDTHDVLHLARLNSSPLVIAHTTDGSLFFASTEDAIFRGVHAAGLWIEDMLDVSEGQYFTVQEGVVTDVQTFTPAFSSYQSYMGGTTSVRTIGSTYGHWETEAYEWQGGRLVRPNDLHAQVEANKRRNMGAIGGVASVTSLSDRLAAEEPDFGSDDDADALDEWLRLNANRLGDYENIAAQRNLATDDDTDAVVADMRKRVAWSRLPTLSTGLFDVKHFIHTPGETEYLGDVRYVNRSEAIAKFSQGMSDKAKADCARLLKVYARPGDAVKTIIDGLDYVGHIVLMPETFPSGDYVLRVFAPNKKRIYNHEAILVSKPYHEFEVIGRGDKIQDTADMSEALQNA